MAVAVPAGKEPPIVLDMATTVAEYGKVKTKAQRGETMPVGWSRCMLDDPAGRCCGSCLQFYEFGDTTPAGALDIGHLPGMAWPLLPAAGRREPLARCLA